MADYTSAFSEFLNKENPQTTLPTGERESTLTTGSWQYGPPKPCSGCSAHICSGGDHCPVGNHYSLVPIADNQSINMPKFIRGIQNYLHYQNWLVVGEVSANPAFLYNGDAGNNFSTWKQFNILNGGGQWLCLESTSSTTDPRNTELFWMATRENDGDPLTYTRFYGSWCSVGMQLDIAGNSVDAGRIKCKIIDNDFSSLAEDGTGMFWVMVDQNIDYVMTPYDPNSTLPPYVLIYQQCYMPEAWQYMPDSAPFFCVETQIEIDASTISNNILELKDNNGNSTKIALPRYDGESEPGNPNKSIWKGTFKLGIDYGSGYQDINLRSVNNGAYQWSRIYIDNGPHTKLYLGLNGPDGNPVTGWTNLLTNAQKLRVTYCYKVADSSVVNSFSPNQCHCGNDLRDFNNVVAKHPLAGTGIDAKGNHWFCNCRSIVDTSDYQPGKCYRFGTCPNFTYALPPQITSSTWADLYNQQNEKIVELCAGSSSVMNFVITRVKHPSFHWLVNPTEPYDMNRGYWAWSQSLCGGFGDYIIYHTGMDGANPDQTVIKWVNGAIYNYAMDNRSALVYPNLPIDPYWWNRDCRGLFSRNINLQSNRQDKQIEYKDGYYNWIDSDSSLWRGIQAPASCMPDVNSPGSALYYGNRTVAGIEGMNRIQRFNRSTTAYVSNVDKSKTGIQPSGSNHTALFFTTPLTINGVDYGGYLKLRADGADDYGPKRMGGFGINGEIYRVESIGNNKYKIHCMLGCYTVKMGIADQSDILSYCYAGGNVVALPDIYRIKSHYGSPNDKYYGGPWHKAIPGDTFRLGSNNFYIVDAQACSGDNLAGAIQTTNTMQTSGVPGIVFTPPDNVTSYVINKYEVKFIDGSWSDLTPYIRKIPNNGTRSFDPDDMFLYWESDTLDELTKTLKYNQSNIPVAGNIITLTNSTNTERYEFFQGHSYTGANIGVEIGYSTDFSWSNLVNAINAVSVIATASQDADNSKVVFISENKTTVYMTVTSNVTGSIITSSIKDYGTNRAYLSYGNYYHASYMAVTANRQVRITYTADGVQSTVTKTIDGCYINLYDPNISQVNQWTIGKMDSSGNMVSYDFYGLNGDDFGSDIPMGQFGYNLTDGRIMFNPNESGNIIFCQWTTNTVIDVSSIPNSVDMPKVADKNYLKYCDVVTIQDEGDYFANNYQYMGGAGFEVHTSGVLSPYDPVTVSYSIYGIKGWNVINPSDCYVYRADGYIYIKQSFIDTLPKQVCFKVDCARANRTPETPKELVETTVQHCNCLDTVKAGGVLGFGTGFTMQADIRIGCDGWKLYTIGDSYNICMGAQPPGYQLFSPEPGKMVRGLEYGTINNYNDAGNKGLLLLETAKQNGVHDAMSGTSGTYNGFYWNQALGWDVNDFITRTYVAGEGYLNPSYTGTTGFSVGCDSYSYMGMGGKVWSNVAIFNLNINGIVSKLPIGTQISRATMDLELGPATQMIEHTRYFVYSQNYAGGGTFEPNIPNHWQFYPDEDIPLADRDKTVIKTDNIDISFILVGKKNNGEWVFLENLSSVLSQGKAGKTVQVDASQIINAMMFYKDSPFQYLGFFVGCSKSPQYLPFGSVDTNKEKGFLQGVMQMEDFNYTGSYGDIHKFYQNPTWSQRKEMFGHKFNTVARTFSGDYISARNLVFSYQLPDEVIWRQYTNNILPPLN